MPPSQSGHRVSAVQLEGQMRVRVNAIKTAPVVTIVVGKVGLVPFVNAREAGQQVGFFLFPKLAPGNAERPVGAVHHPIKVTNE